MTSDQRLVMKLGTGLGMAGLVLLMIRTGTYGLSLFTILPIASGAFGAWIGRPKTAKNAALVGLAANAIASLALLGFGFDGIICIAMALPLALPLGAFGGWMAFRFTNKRILTSGTATLMLLPLSLGVWGLDVTAKPDVFQVRSSVEIAASPSRVWGNVVSFSELPPPNEWFFKAGIAYPMRARIEGAGPGAIRYCEFSTGPFVEPIQVWDEPHLLRFSVVQNPAPMNEWSPYAKIMPRHLHGYFVSKQGQFSLTPLPNGHTLLEGTTWYQHGLWPEAYWTVWSQAIIHRIHMRVLNHIKRLSEMDLKISDGAVEEPPNS